MINKLFHTIGDLEPCLRVRSNFARTNPTQIGSNPQIQIVSNRSVNQPMEPLKSEARHITKSAASSLKALALFALLVLWWIMIARYPESRDAGATPINLTIQGQKC
jgi:hypothetical protein